METITCPGGASSSSRAVALPPTPPCRGVALCVSPELQVLMMHGSHVLELENRIKWLEDIVSSQCPGVDLTAGPPVELRSRASPPAIRIVTTGPDFEQAQSMSSTSSPVFALSPASTCPTPVSFDFSSPGVSPGYLQPMSPFTFSDASPAPSPFSSPFLQPQNTLAHEVGLLSLSGAGDPKYLGPSSGAAFARMVFADARDNDVLHQPLADIPEVKPPPWGPTAPPAPFPATEDCITFTNTYFEIVHPQYPFLHRPTFDACLEAVYHNDSKHTVSNLPPGYTMSAARFHVYLVLSIGASILSTRLGTRFDSDGYFSASMTALADIRLTRSVQSIQSALLLAMKSLQAPGGWNIWYLNATVVATCVDLGLHRKLAVLPGHESTAALKRRVFWSAYALDRNVCIALGRPFGILEGSYDVELPDEGDNDEELTTPTSLSQSSFSPSAGTARASFSGSIYLLRIIRAIAIIRNRIYQISQTHFHGHSDLSEWQLATHRHIMELRDQARTSLGGIRRGSNSGAGHQIQTLDLKYHEAVQLLFRPSPTFPGPSSFALQQCFQSAVDTLRIYSKMKRFRELPYTYLTALSIFLSGITMLYAYRNCREVQSATGKDLFQEDIASCSLLLADLGQRWPSALRSRARFDEFAQANLAFHANASSRMLSPHDGARRASVSSHRSMIAADLPPSPQPPPLPPSQQQQQQQVSPSLDLPSPGPRMVPQQQHAWYGGGPSPGPGGPGGMLGPPAGHGFDTSWMSTISWEDLQLPPGGETDMACGGMEGLETAPVDGVDAMLSNLMGEDTPMWGMDPPMHRPPPPHDQRQ